MSGFRKAKTEQAFLKVSMYGKPGSGKTFTSLLLGEGLAKLSKKRMAFVDTERGTDFYCQTVKERAAHPEAFDFDALYTTSLFEILKEVKALDPNIYNVVIIDSITHVWESCRSAFSGKTNKAGQIPMHAWGPLKRPYKELMNFLIFQAPFHVFLLGRQGNEFGEDEDTGEMKKLGDKMKAEGETQHEPHVCIHMYTEKNGKEVVPIAYFEKDRSGILAYNSIAWPNFDNVCKPMLKLLGTTQAGMVMAEDAGAADGETYAILEARKTKDSEALLREWSARIDLAKTADELQIVGKGISKEIKARMTNDDVATLRGRFALRDAELKPNDPEATTPSGEQETLESEPAPAAEKPKRQKKEKPVEEIKQITPTEVKTSLNEIKSDGGTIIEPNQSVAEQLQEEMEKPVVEPAPVVYKCKACRDSKKNSKGGPCPLCTPRNYCENPKIAAAPKEDPKPLKNQSKEPSAPPIQSLEVTFEKAPVALGKGNFKFVTDENEMFYSNAPAVKTVVDANMGDKIHIGVQEIDSRMVIVSARQIV